MRHLPPDLALLDGEATGHDGPHPGKRIALPGLNVRRPANHLVIVLAVEYRAQRQPVRVRVRLRVLH